MNIGLCYAKYPKEIAMKVMDDFIARVTRVNVIAGLNSEIRGLRKAGDALLGLYIKDIDVLTKEKLVAIRRMRNILKRYD